MAVNPRADILRGAPYFPVADVARTGDYYREVLGFEREYQRRSAGVRGVQPERVADHVPPCGGRDPDPAERKPGRHVGRVLLGQRRRGVVDELARKGAVTVYAPVVQPYGMKEFAVRDPNGYSPRDSGSNGRHDIALSLNPHRPRRAVSSMNPSGFVGSVDSKTGPQRGRSRSSSPPT